MTNDGNPADVGHALESERVVVPIRADTRGLNHALDQAGQRAAASREQALAELCEQQRQVIWQYAVIFNMTADAIEHVFSERAKSLRKLAATAEAIARVGKG